MASAPTEEDIDQLRSDMLALVAEVERLRGEVERLQAELRGRDGYIASQRQEIEDMGSQQE